MITHILIIQNFVKYFILNIIIINITLISIILYYIDNIEYRRNINLSPSHPPPHESPFFPPHPFYLIGNLHAGWIVCGDAMCSDRKDPLVPEHSPQTAKLHLIHIHSTWVLLLKHWHRQFQVECIYIIIRFFFYQTYKKIQIIIHQYYKNDTKTVKLKDTKTHRQTDIYIYICITWLYKHYMRLSTLTSYEVFFITVLLKGLQL